MGYRIIAAVAAVTASQAKYAMDLPMFGVRQYEIEEIALISEQQH